MDTPPRETRNVPRRTNDRESGEYVTDPGREGDVVIKGLCTGHTGPLNGVAWSSDGSLLATVGDDHTCVIWNPHTGDPVATNNPIINLLLFFIFFNISSLFKIDIFCLF